MANTTNFKGSTIEITGLDADWDSATDLGIENLKLNSITFDPSAAGDIMVIRNGSSTGPACFYASCDSTYSQKIKYFHGEWVHPVINISECTLSSPSDARVILEVF